MIRFIRRFRSLSLKTKVNLWITITILGFGLIWGWLVINTASTSLLEEAKERGRAIASHLAYMTEEPLLAMDSVWLKNSVDEVKAAHKDILYAFVMDKYGHVPGHTFESGFPVDLLKVNQQVDKENGSIQLLETEKGMVYDIAVPVKIAGDHIGLVRVGLWRNALDKTVSQLQYTSALLTVLVALLTIVTVSWFARGYTRRINALKESAEEVVKGHLDVQTGPELKKNCWEMTGCENVNCPAYGDKRRRCWYLVGTFSPMVRSEEYNRARNCQNCPVYQRNAGDEIQNLAESFDFMALTLKERIQEIQEAKQELSKRKQLLRTILDVTPDMVALQDVNFVYQAVNKSFCDYFKLAEQDIVGKIDFDIFTRSQAEQNREEDRQILKTGKPLSKEITVKGAQDRRWFHIIKVPVYNNGTIEGLLLTVRDVTVIKQYQERLIQLQKMEDLGRLAGGIAHEINTPLGIILGYTQMLLEDVPQESQMKEDLEIVEKQTKICSTIVQNLLGFSRQSGSTKISTDCNQSLQEVISLVEHTFSLNRVRIRTNFDPDLPLIQADKEQLKQVWINLLNNAFDAIGSDGLIFVQTGFDDQKNKAVIKVMDTGSGLSNELQKRIFEPFFSTKSQGKGTGLGLSVSFGIVKDHGGWIKVVSPVPDNNFFPEEEVVNQDKQSRPGTVFFVELPLVGDSLPDEEDWESNREWIVRRSNPF